MNRSPNKSFSPPLSCLMGLPFAVAALAFTPGAIGAIFDQIEEQYEDDPYLGFQPSFAYSLPVQILLTGIILSLVVVLLIHLLFTAQYHWPLAKLNYALQISGVASLLITLLFTLYVVLRAVHKTSRQWPYMLNYIAFSVPPDDPDPDWSLAARIAWYTMEATTSGLAHITHIQFLTLLYPSLLEARLIFLLLGPLAIASSACSFIDLSDDPGVHDLGDSIRNVCNSALSLLFTTALVIWGFLINRRHAWRTEGGTAAFGAGAIALALCSCALNFMTIPHLPPVWLPGLVWAVVLWQSFLGWWWWVGSGVGLTELEEKPKKRREKREPVRKPKLADSTPTARLSRVSGTLRDPPDTAENRVANNNTGQPPQDSMSSTGSWTSNQSSFTPLNFLRWCWANLRHAHLKATRLQAAQTVEKRMQVYGRDGAAPGTGGWSLGAFGLREREQVQRRIATNTNQVASSDTSSITEDEPRQARGPTQSEPPLSWSWWGPLRRWRFQDRTVY